MIASLVLAVVAQCGPDGCAVPGLFARRAYTVPSYVSPTYVQPSYTYTRTYSPWQSYVSAYVDRPIEKKWLWCMYEGKRRLVWGWVGDDGKINWYQNEQPDPTTPTSQGVDETKLVEPGDGRERPKPEPPPRHSGNIGNDEPPASAPRPQTQDTGAMPAVGTKGKDNVTNFGVDVSKMDRGHSIRASDEKTLNEVLKVAADSKIANQEAERKDEDDKSNPNSNHPEIKIPNPITGLENVVKFALEMAIAAILFITGFLLLRGKR
jgi:hypothetical protein